MTDWPPGRASSLTLSRIAAVVAIAACVAVFVAANAHLVVVSFRSQPDCVPHLKVPGEGAAYRAAESSC